MIAKDPSKHLPCGEASATVETGKPDPDGVAEARGERSQRHLELLDLTGVRREPRRILVHTSGTGIDLRDPREDDDVTAAAVAVEVQRDLWVGRDVACAYAVHAVDRYDLSAVLQKPHRTR